MIIKNKHYNGTVTVVFDSFKHRYTNSENGEVVTSVTQALSVINKPALVNWAANMAVDYVSEQIKPGASYDELELATIWDMGRKAHYQKKVDAGNIGTLIHKWVEGYIKGEQPAVPVNEDLKDSIDQFLQWVERHQVKFLSSEQPIFSKKYSYTGTLDFVCRLDNKLFIGDLKTSNGIYPEHFIQTSAYRQARAEEFPQEQYDGQLIVRIGKDGSFEFARCTDFPTYKTMFIAFVSALKLQQTLEILKDYKAERE